MTLIISFLFITSWAQADSFNFFSITPNAQQLDKLVKTRQAYLDGQWDRCFNLAIGQAKQKSPTQDWSKEFALRCARGQYIDSKNINLLKQWWTLFHNNLPDDPLVWNEIKKHWLGLLELMSTDPVSEFSKWTQWFVQFSDLTTNQRSWVSALSQKQGLLSVSIAKFYFEPSQEVTLYQLWQSDKEGKSAAQYLSDFPGGKFIENVEQGLYVQLLKNPELKFNNLVLASRERLMRRAHRQGDYSLAYKIAQSILESVRGHADALFIGGRSQYFRGQYSSAVALFQELIDRHPTYIEAEDVVLRLGFAFMRQQKWGEAEAHWKKILQSYPKPGLELVARYWSLVTRQKSDAQVVQTAQYLEDKKLLIERFPYTYYALKLAGVRLDPGPVKKISKSQLKYIVLSQDQVNWKSMVYLAQSGWWDEANKIYRTLNLPDDASFKELAIPYFTKIKFVPALSPLINEWLNGGKLLDFKSLQSIYPTPLEDIIHKYSASYKLSPELIWSVIRQESIFLSQIESSAKAVGLMQMIPATASEVAKSLNINLRDWSFQGRSAKVNIQMGTYYLQNLVTQFDKNELVALAAYNYGPTRLKTWLNARADIYSSDPLLSDLWIEELPAQETQFYVKAIERNRIIYRYILDSGPNKK